MVYFDWYSCRVSGRKNCPGRWNGFVGEPDCGNHWWRVGRLAFRHHGNMDNGCYREFDHGDRGGDCVAGDGFVVQ